VPGLRRRLTIITEIIAPYRIPVFNALAEHPEIDLHVIFLAETDSTQRQWLVYKDEIRFSYEVLPSWRRRLRKQNLLVNWGVTAALRQAAPDVIVCGGYNYVASWRSLSWARDAGVPFLLWVESTAKDQRRNSSRIEALKKRFMQECSGFIVPGKASFEYVRKFGISAQKISVAPNAVDTQFFTRHAEKARRDAAAHCKALDAPSRFFLFAGRLVPEKGIFDLLDAYAMLPPELRREIALVLVGDGPVRAELARRAAGIVAGLVKLAGFAQREQLASYYALAETFVFPTHTDPWGLVVNEAAACGLPIIASDAAGCVPDLVEDRWNGRVVPAHDVAQLAIAMEELAGNAEVRAVMSQRSRDRIHQYSPQACAAGIADGVLSWEAVLHER
jgi:glycosyltransferase involved in cell wall biosynthesis